MTVRAAMHILDAEMICGETLLDRELHTGWGSDLMSDVLAASVSGQAVLMSGLLNPQVIRTAEMMDMQCVVFVRGKRPTEEIVKIAEEMQICVLATKYNLYNACGLMYESGLRSVDEYSK